MTFIDLASVLQRPIDVVARVAATGSGILVAFEKKIPARVNDGYIPNALVGALALARVDGRVVASGIVAKERGIHPSEIRLLVVHLARTFLIGEDGADHCHVAVVDVDAVSGVWWSGEESSACLARQCGVP